MNLSPLDDKGIKESLTSWLLELLMCTLLSSSILELPEFGGPHALEKANFNIIHRSKIKYNKI
jgi:hypothetical protein